MNYRQSLSTAILLLGLQALNTNAVECDGIDCPSDILPPEECFDQGCDLPPENEAPACDEQECPPIDDCQDPQSCEGPIDGPGDGPGETANYAVSMNSGSAVTILSTDITADGDIYVEVYPQKGTATNNQGASVTFDTNGDFSNLEEGVTEEVAFEVYTTGTDVTYSTITVTVTGVAEEEPQTEEPVDQAPGNEVSLNAGVMPHDTLSRNGELNDGEFVTVWMDTQRLAAGEALVIRDIPDHLTYIETLSADLPADASSTMPFRTQVLGSFYREEDRTLRISPRSGDTTSTPAVHIVFKASSSESDENTALLIERLDSTGLEATTTTVEIPPAQAAKYYYEIARNSNGAVVTAWPPKDQQEDFVRLEANLSSDPSSLTCSESDTLLTEGLLDGDGNAIAECAEGIITATHTDAKVSATTPLTWPLSFIAEESNTLFAGGSITFSDGSSLSMEDSTSSTVETGVELVSLKDYVDDPNIRLRMELPEDIQEATNLTVDLLIVPGESDDPEAQSPQFTCTTGWEPGVYEISYTLQGDSFVSTCTKRHVHIAFPVGMAVSNQSDFSDGLLRIDIYVANAKDLSNIEANLLTITSYDESDGPAVKYSEFSAFYEDEEEESLGIVAAVLALLTFAYYRRRKQVA